MTFEGDRNWNGGWDVAVPPRPTPPPNPNLHAPPFVDGWPLPASSLNRVLAFLGIGRHGVSPGPYQPLIQVSERPPENAQQGWLWWDPVSTQLYVRYDDGNHAQWVIAVNNEEIATGVAEISLRPPEDPQPGTLWFDPRTTQLYVYYDDGRERQWVIAVNAGRDGGLEFPLRIERGGTGATTAQRALANLGGAPIQSPYFLGMPVAQTPPQADNSTRLATTAFVQRALNENVPTFPLSLEMGGTGADDSATALANLGGAPINSPALTGTPTAVTAPAGTNTTQLATTQFVYMLLGGATPIGVIAGGTGATTAPAALLNLGGAPLQSPSFTGSPTAPTLPISDNSQGLATTAFVRRYFTSTGLGAVTSVTAGRGLYGGGTGDTTLSLANPVAIADGGTGAGSAPSALINLGAAPLASPVLTGMPRAPTPTSVGDSSTRLATTAFVQQAIEARALTAVTAGNGLTASIGSTGNVTVGLNRPVSIPNGGTGASVDWQALSNLGGAPLRDPTLQGIPRAPTAAPGTETSQIATTAYVRTEILRSIGPGTGISRITVRSTAPANPNPGDFWFDTSGGQLYVLDRGRWVIAVNPVIPRGSNIYVNSRPPENPENGDLWFDTVSVQTFVWYDDGTSRQWVVAVNPPKQEIPPAQRPTHVGQQPPLDPKPGDLWFDTGSVQLFCYYDDGTSSQWVIAVNPEMPEIPRAVHIGEEPPDDPQPGDLWFDSVSVQLFLRYDDGNSVQWVAASAVPAADPSRVIVSELPPDRPDPGQLWFDPVSVQLFVWYQDADSAQWVVANAAQINNANFWYHRSPPPDPVSGMAWATPAGELFVFDHQLRAWIQLAPGRGAIRSDFARVTFDSTPPINPGPNHLWARPDGTFRIYDHARAEWVQLRG